MESYRLHCITNLLLQLPKALVVAPQIQSGLRTPPRTYSPPDNNQKRRPSDASSRGSSKAPGGRSPPPEPEKSWEQILAEEAKTSPNPSQCLFIRWDDFARFRQVPVSAPPENALDWSTEKEESRVISGRGANGQFLQSEQISQANAVGPADWPRLTQFFNKRFQLSEAKATSIEMSKFPYWQKTALNYKVSNDAPNEVSGFKFTTSARGGGESPPGPAEGKQYVKIGTVEGTVLFNKDDTAGRRGITKDEIYVARSVMEQLKPVIKGGQSAYDWAKNSNTIPIRQKSGRVNYIEVPSEYQKGEFWTSAWDHGVAKQDGKAVRSRNVGALKLLLVVQDNTSGVTTTLLADLIKTVNENAVIPIKQTVQIVTEKDSADPKKTYTRKVILAWFPCHIMVALIIMNSLEPLLLATMRLGYKKRTSYLILSPTQGIPFRQNRMPLSQLSTPSNPK